MDFYDIRELIYVNNADGVIEPATGLVYETQYPDGTTLELV
jgi:hypothetical protein